MKNWKNLSLVLLFLLLLGIFWYIWNKYPKEVVKVEVELRDNYEKIDSLTQIIKEKSLEIDSLKTVKEKVVEKVVIRVKEVRTLPPDSTIDLFYHNVQTYGEIESERPELMEDSGVICPLNNLRGANVITAKLEGKIEEGKILSEMLNKEEEIIKDKDSIIQQNSIILLKTQEAYDTRLEELNRRIKTEGRIKKTSLYGNALLIGVIGSLILFGK